MTGLTAEFGGASTVTRCTGPVPLEGDTVQLRGGDALH